MSARERLRYVLFYLLLDGCVSYLFFYSLAAFFLLLPGAVLFFSDRKNMLQKKREQLLRRQFMDAIQLMASALQAGYSAENALRAAAGELCKVYQEEDSMVQEFRFMESQLAMNRNLEDLLLDFGRRSGVDDIQSFAEVFLTAKRSGGDLIAIIRNTVSCIRQKQETMQEIETCMAGKVMEQNIMSMTPILILAYVKLTSAEFLSVMYGNVTGIAVMTVCFLVYAAAFFWGRSIVRIEV